MPDDLNRKNNSLDAQRKKALHRGKTLLQERQTGWDGHWQAIATNLLPRLSRFMTTDRNRGGDRNQAIIDSAGTWALRTLAAGMMAGMTSPARPWFKLGLPDEDLAEHHSVKLWLADVTRLMQRIFRKSNTYNTFHGMYRELGGFGTSLSVVESNFDTVIHNNLMTIGQFSLGTNHLGMIDKVAREFKLTVEEAVEWFGLEALGPEARNAYDCSNYGKQIEILHIIEPNPDRDPRKIDKLNMPFKSVYWDKRDTTVKMGQLKAGGYRRFPAIAPRWDVLWGDTWGSSPAMDALGDLLQLQNNQLRKDKAIDYRVDPPLQVPTAMRGQGDFLPGGISYYDGYTPNGGVRTAFEVNLDPNLLLEDIADVRGRINKAFYADLFLLIADTDKRMTATEVAERQEEKLLMLGPVLERLHNEMLSPYIAMTFERMIESGILPPPPPELAEVELEVEYVSVLAQAQRAVGVNATDRLVGHIGMLAQLGKVDVVDKFDTDKSVERYADQLGVDPDLIVSGENVALVRSQRAQQQAAAQAAENAAKMGSAMQSLGSIQTGAEPQQNAASDLMNLFSGYNAAPPA